VTLPLLKGSPEHARVTWELNQRAQKPRWNSVTCNDGFCLILSWFLSTKSFCEFLWVLSWSFLAVSCLPLRRQCHSSRAWDWRYMVTGWYILLTAGLQTRWRQPYLKSRLILGSALSRDLSRAPSGWTALSMGESSGVLQRQQEPKGPSFRVGVQEAERTSMAFTKRGQGHCTATY
jgi:hypothetical protein